MLTVRQQKQIELDRRVTSLLAEAHRRLPDVSYDDLLTTTTTGPQLLNAKKHLEGEELTSKSDATAYAYRPYSRVLRDILSSKPTPADYSCHPSYHISTEKEEREETQRNLNKALVVTDEIITGEEMFVNYMQKMTSDVGGSVDFGEPQQQQQHRSNEMGASTSSRSNFRNTASSRFAEDVDFAPTPRHHHTARGVTEDSSRKPQAACPAQSNPLNSDGAQPPAVSTTRRAQRGRVSPNRRSGKVIMCDENEGGLLYDATSGNVMPFSIHDLLSTNVKIAVAVELTYNRVFTGELLAPFRAIRLARTVLPQLSQGHASTAADPLSESQRSQTSDDAGAGSSSFRSVGSSRRSNRQMMALVAGGDGDELQALNSVGSEYLAILRQLQGRAVMKSTQLIREHSDHLDGIVSDYYSPTRTANRTNKYRSIFDGLEVRATGEAVEEWEQRGSANLLSEARRKGAPNRYGNKWFAPVSTWAENPLGSLLMPHPPPRIGKGDFSSST